MSSRSRLISRILAGMLVLAATAPALADGMPEPEHKAVPRVHRHHSVRHVHRHHVHAYRTESRPLIGYVIKHVHEDLGSPVYAQPAWPACQYVLDTFLVRTVRDSYTGHFDCGS
jgi:hypothetical protein